MQEIVNFQKKRIEFLEKQRKAKGEIELFSELSPKHREPQMGEKEHKQSDRQEQNVKPIKRELFNVPKKYSAPIRTSQKYKEIVKKNKKINKKIAALIVAGALGISTIVGYGVTQSKNQLNSSPVNQREEVQNSSIQNPEQLLEINELKSIINRETEFTSEELKDIGIDLENIMMETIKSKIKNSLNLDDTTQITLHPRKREVGASINVGSEIYNEQDGLNGQNTISKEIADNIEGLRRIQVTNENITRHSNGKILNAYKEEIGKIEEFAQKTMKINQNGNIILEEPKVLTTKNSSEQKIIISNQDDIER